jgi:hypothetical protein
MFSCGRAKPTTLTDVIGRSLRTTRGVLSDLYAMGSRLTSQLRLGFGIQVNSYSHRFTCSHCRPFGSLQNSISANFRISLLSFQ